MMTRKRYIKQLMAVGASRNTAVRSAQAACASGKSYDLVSRAVMFWIYGHLIAEVADIVAGRPGAEARADG